MRGRSRPDRSSMYWNSGQSVEPGASWTPPIARIRCSLEAIGASLVADPDRGGPRAPRHALSYQPSWWSAANAARGAAPAGMSTLAGVVMGRPCSTDDQHAWYLAAGGLQPDARGPLPVEHVDGVDEPDRLGLVGHHQR